MAQKVAFLFPGQGAQTPGMGKEFSEKFAVSRETFEQADDVLGYGLSKIVFEGPEDTLTQTKHSQPGIYVTSIAILRAIQAQFPDLQPRYCAGHSLGEYSAVTASKKVAFDQLLPVVQLRGEAMNDACEEHQGCGMAAVIGFEGAQVRDCIEELQMPDDVWVANFNCPGQVVITGTKKGIDAATAKLRDAGARRVMPLQVHGAFHSPLMRSAEQKLSQRVKALELKESKIRLAMNVCGCVVEDNDEIQDNLILQVTRPVMWEQCIRDLAQQGVDLFVEIGPGKVLSGLNKRIGVSAPTLHVEKIADLDALASNLEESTVG